MSDTLSSLPNNIQPSPRNSCSPSRAHTLRPRRSFQRFPFSPKPQLINAPPSNSSVDLVESLRSPLKINNNKNNSNTAIPTINVKTNSNASNKSTRGRLGNNNGVNGSLLFPSSPMEEDIINTEQQPQQQEIIRPVRESASLKKFATTLTGAFNSKSKVPGNSTKGFDLSAWNYDLAAIASDPCSSSASKPIKSQKQQQHSNSTNNFNSYITSSSTPYSTHQLPQPSSDDLVTPTTSNFPTLSALPKHLDLRLGLELPISETRRRKSDEMEDEDRVEFITTAPSVRRELPGSNSILTLNGVGGNSINTGSTVGNHHNRSHSLAHAHTLRSSRTLSSHQTIPTTPITTINSNSHQSQQQIVSPRIIVASTSANTLNNSGPAANTRNAVSSSSSGNLNSNSNPSPVFGTNQSNRFQHPPSKKISMEKFASPVQGGSGSGRDSQMSESGSGLLFEAGAGGEESDSNVFGGRNLPSHYPHHSPLHPRPTTTTSTSSASQSGSKKAQRTKSLSRTTNPLFQTVSPSSSTTLPASNSHPGWTGNGFNTATNTTTLSRIRLPSNSSNNSNSTSSTFNSNSNPSPMFSRTTRASTGSSAGLSTLEESGPAVDYFSVEGGGGGVESSVMTPPRRRGEGFSLFGNNSTGSGALRRERKDNVMDDEDEEEEVLREVNLELRRRKSSTGHEDYYEDLITPSENNSNRPFFTPIPLGGKRISHLTIDTGNGSSTPFSPSVSSGNFPSTSTSSNNSNFPSRRAASLDSLFLASIFQGPNHSPFNRPGTITTPNGKREMVNPSVHNLRDQPGRKRNANGALLVGNNFGIGGSSRLAANSPIIANQHSSSPATSWNVRDSSNSCAMEDEDDEEEGGEEDVTMDEDVRLNWENGTMSPPPPPLTDDGTTSASSSLSTSLSSHAEGDQSHSNVTIAGSNSTNLINSAGSSSNLVSAGAVGGNNNNPTWFTPQNYKNVKPLQAAFMSAGLVSKMSRGGNSMGNTVTGSQLGGGAAAPSFNLPQLQQPDFSTSTTSSIESKLNQQNKLNDSFNGTTATLPLVNPLLAAIRGSNIMPDTPVKKAAFAHTSLSTSTIPTSLPPSPLPIDLTTSTRLSKLLDESPNSLSPLGPTTTSNSTSTTSTSNTISPCSGRSGDSSDVDGSASSNRTRTVCGDVSPTVHASRSSTRASVGTWKRPALFRRRSSGQLSNESSFLSVQNGPLRSGSSGNSFMEGEPMTPTRSAGAKWSEVPQLIETSGGDSPITPATSAFPPHYFPTTTFLPPPIATPHLRQSFPLSEAERKQQNAHSRPPVSRIGRPQFKQRHSGSVLLSLRQQEMQQPDWFETNFTIMRSLGNGAFSDAYEVFDKQRGSTFAVKRTKHPFGGPKDRLRRLEEVDILRLFSSDDDRSPHLISLVDAWEQSGHLFIQSELCENGNLASFLEEYGSLHEILDETRIWKILTEVAAGVAHLHSRNVIHLDLKPANIFITMGGNLKIGDFGLATRWPRADALSIVRGAAVISPGSKWQGTNTSEETIWRSTSASDGGDQKRIRAKSNGTHEAAVDLEREGDREYLAPEIMSGRYGKQADVFSLGLIILEVAGNVVMPDNGPIWHKLRSNDLSDVNLSPFSPELIQLLTAMLDKNPDQRITIEQLMLHPIVSRLKQMLDESNIPEEEVEEGGESTTTVSILGGVVEERESFLSEVFEFVYNRETSTIDNDAGDEMDIDD